MELFNCVAYQPSMAGEWDRLAAAAGSIYHTTAFRRILLESFGYRCLYHAVLDRDERVCALLPLVEGRNLGLRRAAVSLPFVNYLDICAVSGAARRFAQTSLPALCAQRRLAYLEMRLKDQDWDEPGWQAAADQYSFSLPLAADEEQVLALSTAGNRNHVRKVYRNNWFAVSFDPGHLEAFYRVYVRRMKQLGSPAPALAFFERFFQYLPDAARLLSVLDRDSGRVVGGMLLLLSPGDQTLYYPYGANAVEYNAKYLNNFMYWEAVRLGIRCGLRRLDLGRSPAGSGTYAYKRQWGAEPCQLRYLLYSESGYAPPGRSRFDLAVKLWRAAPAFITGRAGPRLIRYVLP
ncbi:MAG: GNAT family N-acetyltransferase [Sporomusaceae bacterium]|nr:GNAT family N-acetyltransferase [Sporomusaceae bacterium]